MIKSASTIFKEFQPTLDGQEAIEPEEWMVMAFKAYAEQFIEKGVKDLEEYDEYQCAFEILNLKQQLI